MNDSSSAKVIEWLKSAGGITVTCTILVAIAVSFHKGPYVLVNTLVTGGMWALMAIGVSLLFGVMNISNFAHGEYFMIGSLTAYYIMNPLKQYLLETPNDFLSFITPILGIAGAAIVGAIAGIVTDKTIFAQLRKRNREGWLLNCFLITIGIQIILINVHMLVFGNTFKGVVNYWDVPSVAFGDVYVSVDRVVVFGIAMAAIVLFWYLMMYTSLGKKIRAVAQDENGARMVGIQVNGVYSTTFALACGFAALAGGSLLFMFPSYPTVGVAPLYNSWFIIILVGFGNVAGAVPGGFMIALFQVVTRTYMGEGWENVIPMFLIAMILIFKPYGIFATKVRSVWEQ
ncbi:branched-chain amino acid ABC transporter permease [Desulforhopalus singaporensis]|uniref:Branched-chain amino acid transport system permease protein n=1 Tax=Desulforhopalus singaporensis TaxID=91360 RepID=A0A1H0KE93_9BACT|nr:branched-chain amino acid ABC transporter permease [Desulforhopalus singaporensis]SDO54274.1 branched-chain amino acid transport system permease protein [Desulforhopalus singaporensis]